MKIDIEKVKEDAKKNFEKTWFNSSKYLKLEKSDYKITKGKSNIVFDTIEKLREIYLDIGFTERVVPTIVEDKHIKKQYGPESYAILDRCYYLAGLPRPNIGISDDRLKKIESLGIKIKSKDILQKIFHRYKKNEIDGDDLIDEIKSRLNLDEGAAITILDSFPELKDLSPKPTNLTLRSHITSGWFLVLSKLIGRKKSPVKLFTVDVRFRREQKEDATHLKVHRAASSVYMGEDVSIDLAKKITKLVLSKLGFKTLKYKRKEATANYYMPQTEYEVFAKLAKSNELIEVADFGIYSPIALANYGIDVPVLNIGIGIERLCMIFSDTSDIRSIISPEIYREWELKDSEISSMIKIDRGPETELGRKIKEKIAEGCKKYADVKSPAEFLVYQDKNHKVFLYEDEKNTKLCGPAIFNEIYVYAGSIYALPKDKKVFSEVEDIFENGINTKISFLDAFASLSAYNIEKKEEKTRIKMVKGASDINIKIDQVAYNYILGKKNKIGLKGPVFCGVRCEFIG